MENEIHARGGLFLGRVCYMIQLSGDSTELAVAVRVLGEQRGTAAKEGSQSCVPAGEGSEMQGTISLSSGHSRGNKSPHGISYSLVKYFHLSFFFDVGHLIVTENVSFFLPENEP